MENKEYNQNLETIQPMSSEERSKLAQDYTSHVDKMHERDSKTHDTSLGLIGDAMSDVSKDLQTEGLSREEKNALHDRNKELVQMAIDEGDKAREHSNAMQKRTGFMQVVMTFGAGIGTGIGTAIATRPVANFLKKNAIPIKKGILTFVKKVR